MPLDRVPAQPFGVLADRPRRRRRRSFVLFALLFGRHSSSVFSSTDAVESEVPFFALPRLTACNLL
jgi:hypothetical protein